MSGKLDTSKYITFTQGIAALLGVYAIFAIFSSRSVQTAERITPIGSRNARYKKH